MAPKTRKTSQKLMRDWATEQFGTANTREVRETHGTLWKVDSDGDIFLGASGISPRQAEEALERRVTWLREYADVASPSWNLVREDWVSLSDSEPGCRNLWVAWQMFEPESF